MTTAALCRTCGAEPRAGARFCDACGSPVAVSGAQAEYKQVTVLFADVVHSMDIAAAVGAERLREIMTEVFNRSSAVVKRYGGTVDKFTGDGIMAVFGAPVALEDHAFRACLTALGIQQETRGLAADVNLELRIGLNSGEVIAGEIGSGPLSYTTVGEQVGMAQRMESVAPAGGVMLSESTTRLVEHSVTLGEPEWVEVKGAGAAVRARRLLAVEQHRRRRSSESALVGRVRELNFLTAVLDEAVAGDGCVVNIVGPAGIGKSRLVRETTALAEREGVAVFTTYCESHTSDIPFLAISRMLRTGMGIQHVEDEAARALAQTQFSEADNEDLLLLYDLLGVADPTVPLPDIAPDARRRRLAALINAAALAQKDPAVYVIEDVHWVDDVSESMMAEFLSVVPRTPSLVLITSRPEYRGELTRASGAQVIALRPLSPAQGSTLAAELLGTDPSLEGVAARISTRAAGNPFFAEEIVRDLAERGVLDGAPGAFVLRGDAGEIEVPATLQATIGARIDRLSPTAKQTLNAAAVIGSRFDAELLATVIDSADVAPLIDADLVERVRFGRRAEYAFRHPLIHTVAYESQLKSGRAELHLRLAAAIEARDAESVDENAAMIAEQFEAAGQSETAYSWHMRAGGWLIKRDITAARASWRRAQQVADRLSDHPKRLAMRIAPRALLCGTAFRVAGGGADTGFDELRDLCAASGDMRSLALGLNGLATVNLFNAHRKEASRLADELLALLHSIGDTTLTIALSMGAATIKHEIGDMAGVLRVTQRIIDLAGDDVGKGGELFGSPVALARAMRGAARSCMGIAGWKEDFLRAADEARPFDPLTRQAVNFYSYVLPIPYGILVPETAILGQTSEILAMAEQSADDLVLFGAQTARGITLIHEGGRAREEGFGLLATIREKAITGRYSLNVLPVADIHMAAQEISLGEIDEAIALARTVRDELLESRVSIWIGLATAVLVDALLARGDDQDLYDAQAAIDRLAAVQVSPGFVLYEITLRRLRAMLAEALGDVAAYRELRDRYREMASDLGYQGHISWAEAMS